MYFSFREVITFFVINWFEIIMFNGFLHEKLFLLQVCYFEN